MSRKDRFISQVNYSFGSGRMDTWFNDRDLSEFLNFLKKVECVQPLPIRKAATIIGKPSGTDVWVLGDGIIINENGKESPESEFVWLDQALIEESVIPSDDLLPSIRCPLKPDPLKKLNEYLIVCARHNYISSLLVIAGVVMSLHYESIVAMFSGCPIVVALGPSETGKTTAIRAGLSLVGVMQHYVKGTNAFFRQRAMLSTLPFSIDDPPKSTARNSSVDVNELIIDFYNGGKTADLQKGSQKPRSIPVFASNFELKAQDR